jgi:hypothetical protein
MDFANDLGEVSGREDDTFLNDAANFLLCPSWPKDLANSNFGLINSGYGSVVEVRDDRPGGDEHLWSSTLDTLGNSPFSAARYLELTRSNPNPYFPRTPHEAMKVAEPLPLSDVQCSTPSMTNSTSNASTSSSFIPETPSSSEAPWTCAFSNLD